MNIVSGVLFIAGSLSLLYFIICICCVGIGNTFSFAWLALSCCCFLCGMGTRYLYVIKKMPLFIRAAVLAAAAIVIMIYLYAEVKIVTSTHRKPEPKAEYLIVLGAKINGDKVSRALASRLDSAYNYLMDNADTKVIVSGGQGADEQVSEAEAMKAYLMEKGILEERIIMEDASVNTDQNIAFSRNIMKDDSTSVVIVTNSFHLYRAMKIGEKQGLTNVNGIAAPTDKVMALNYYAREGLAVLSYKLRGRI